MGEKPRPGPWYAADGKTSQTLRLMLRKLRRWATLAPVDRQAVTEAWLLLLVVKLTLGWLGLAGCKRLLGALAPRGRRAADSEPVAAPVAAAWLQRWIGAAAANHVSPSRCLERALVLRAMLGRRGHGAELRIGVRRHGAELEAHAWVECGGCPVADDEGDNGGYSVLLPAASGR